MHRPSVGKKLLARMYKRLRVREMIEDDISFICECSKLRVDILIIDILLCYNSKMLKDIR